MEIHEYSLATGSLDKTVKVWNLFKGVLEHTFHGHTKGVWCLKFLTKYLICSGSYDNTIKIWSLKDLDCTRTFNAHTGPVWSLAIWDSYLVSGSHDKTAKVWDLRESQVIHTLEHTNSVFCVDVQDDLIVTGSSNTIKLWTRSNGKFIKSLIVDETQLVQTITSISLCDGFIACSCNQIISIWMLNRDNSSAKKIQEYKEHLRRIESIKLRITNASEIKGFMVSGSQDGQVKYWDISKSKSVHTFKIHGKKGVHSVFFDEFQIATGGADNKINILDFHFPKKYIKRF